MKKINTKDWRPIDGFELDSPVEAVVRSDENSLVVAGPGTGKTEMLAQKASFLLTTANDFNVRRILAISFKKDAAYNLHDRVVMRCGEELGRYFASRTYDAFAKLLLDRFRNALPVELRPTKDYSLVATHVAAELLRQKVGLQISPFALDDNIQNMDFRNITAKEDVAVCDKLLRANDGGSSTLTFPMVLKLAMYIINTAPLIKEGLRCAYSHVMLDEFQDTTELQYQLVKACFGGYQHGITAVGDDNQRIMGWAGAKKNVFDAYTIDFGAVKHNITVNYRSLPRLVDFQKRVNSKLMGTSMSICTANDKGVDTGTVKLFKFHNHLEEAVRLAQEVSSDIRRGVSPREICLLCRVRVDEFLVHLQRSFKDVGLKIRNEATFQDLLKSPIVNLIQSILDLAFNRRQAGLKRDILRQMMDVWQIDPEDERGRLRCFRGLNGLLQKILRIESDEAPSTKFNSLLREIFGILGKDAIQNHYFEYRYGRDFFRRDLGEYERWMESFLRSDAGSLDAAMKCFRGDDSVPLMTIHKSKGLEYKNVYFVGLEDRKFWNFNNNPDEELNAIFVALSRAKEKLAFSFCETRDSQRQSHEVIDGFFSLLEECPYVEVIRGQFEDSSAT